MEKTTLKQQINEDLARLFPMNRSLTGPDNLATLDYIKNRYCPSLIVKNIPSGTQVFDWTIPPERSVKDAFVKNGAGKKIIDFKKNNLHLVSYSAPFFGRLTETELLKHLHTLKDHPEWIPYRTSYYSKNWGFCCKHSLLASKDFFGPFEVCVDTTLDDQGHLLFGEALHEGELEDEIIISTYCCHPSMANDNLSGIITAAALFKEITKQKTKFTYRLLICPETIGALSFLSVTDTSNIVGGTVITCTGGPGKFSIKDSFDQYHWTNIATHLTVDEHTGGEYITYQFVPDGSDERQYSSPGFRISTPSIHKSNITNSPSTIPQPTT